MSAETFAGLNVCPTPAGEKDTAAFSCSIGTGFHVVTLFTPLSLRQVAAV